MRLSYGCPYMGSKNRIAKEIVDFLPPGKRLVDLFGGGGAITHCASLSGKWQEVEYSDVNPLVCEYVVKAFNNGYKDENRWISRERFRELKGIDPYVTFCWSFGNGYRTYMYAKHLEPWKQALYYARVFGDCSWLGDFGIKSDGSVKNIKEHIEEYWQKYIVWYKETYGIDISNRKQPDLNRVQNIEVLQRLNRLNGIGEMSNVTFFCRSYVDYEYEEGDVVYCDPPYENTHQYNGTDFDYKEFYDWVATRPYEVFFSGYEISDPRFVVVKEIKRYGHMRGRGNSDLTNEKIYSNRNLLEVKK